MPAPHADAQHHDEPQEARERQPALHPVHVGDDGFDLIREIVGQTEQEGDRDCPLLLGKVLRYPQQERAGVGVVLLWGTLV